jgi:hypothetical protein
VIEESGEDLGEFQATTVGGYPALRRTFTGLGMVSVVYVDAGPAVVQITANSIVDPSDSMAIFDHMLSTVTFSE